MKVRELIDKLKNQPLDNDVCLYTNTTTGCVEIQVIADDIVHNKVILQGEP